MTPHKLIILTALLSLPTSVFSADTSRYSAQPSVDKAAPSANTNTPIKLKTNVPSGRENLAPAPIARPSPGSSDRLPQSTTRLPGQIKIVRERSNLTVSLAYKHDVCAIHLSPIKGLQGEELFKAGCDLVVTIKNQGGSTTSETNVLHLNMSYSNRTGTTKIVRFIPALRANENKVIIIPKSFIHSFKRAASFTAVVDQPQSVIETNENDNTAIFWLGQ
jgi:hypothetical protein